MVMSVLRWQNKLYGSPGIKYSKYIIAHRYRRLDSARNKRLRIMQHARWLRCWTIQEILKYCHASI